MLKRTEIRSAIDVATSNVEIHMQAPSVKVLHVCLPNRNYGGPGQPTRRGIKCSCTGKLGFMVHVFQHQNWGRSS